VLFYRNHGSTGNILSQRKRFSIEIRAPRGIIFRKESARGNQGTPKISQRKIMSHERSPSKKNSCLLQKVTLKNDFPQKMLNVEIIFNERKAFQGIMSIKRSQTRKSFSVKNYFMLAHKKVTWGYHVQ
jgi:hypothetical protein